MLAWTIVGGLVSILCLHAAQSSPSKGTAQNSEGVAAHLEQALALRDYHLISAKPDERAHPVRKLARIRGISLLRNTDLRRFEADDLRAFSERVRAANPQLLAFPAGSGRIVFDRVRFTDHLAIVDYRQEALLADGRAVPVEGSTFRFFYNLDSELTQIANVTYLGVDGFAAPALDSTGAERALRERAPLLIQRMTREREVEDVPWSPEHFSDAELVVLPRLSGPRLAWRFLVSGLVPEGSEQRRLWIDASDGALLKQRGTIAHAAGPRAPQTTPSLGSARALPPTLAWPRMAGHWKLDGNGDDSYGNEDVLRHPLTPVPPPSAYVPGRVGQALPSNWLWLSRIRVPQSFHCPIDYSYTLMFWVQALGHDSGNPSSIMRRDRLSGGDQAAVTIRPNGHLEAFQSGVYILDPAQLSLGEWIHVAMIYDYNQGAGTGEMRLFKNGQLVGSASGVAPARNTQHGTQYETDGAEVLLDASTTSLVLDDMAIMNWAVPALDVTAIHSNGLQGLDLSSFLPATEVREPRFLAGGLARVFDPHPEGSIFDWPLAANWFDASLYELDEDLHAVSGRYATIRAFPGGGVDNFVPVTWDGVGVYQCMRDYRALFDGSLSIKFLEPQMYYVIDRFRLVMRRLGFAGLLDRSILVYSWSDAFAPSYGDLSQSIFMPSGIGSESLEGSIVLHEYGHALQDGSDGFPQMFEWGCQACCQSGIESEAMSEGGADFFSANHMNDALLYEYNDSVTDVTVDNDFVRANSGGECHDKGRVWTAAWWDLRSRLGSGIVTSLSLQWIFYVTSADDFDDALESCVLQADQDLFGGVHEDTIRRVFSVRNIYGGAGSYPWSSPFPMSQRPYTDNVDQTQSFTAPGASALRVTFDAYTKARWYEPSAANPDHIHVMDGTGAPIAGSPFIARQLQNQTVTVPGDTVQVRLQSMPNDTFVAAGYRVINVATENPANVPPVAVLEASRIQGKEPVVVEFDVSGSADPDGSVIAYTLDPGDGGPVIQLDPEVLQVAHIYHRDGPGPLLQTKTFPAVLTVTDSGGDVRSTSVPITIEPYGEDRRVQAAGSPAPGVHACSIVNGVLICP